MWMDTLLDHLICFTIENLQLIDPLKLHCKLSWGGGGGGTSSVGRATFLRSNVEQDPDLWVEI